MEDERRSVLPQGPAAALLGFPAFAGRSAAVGEVHARPAPLLETPRLLLQLAFMTSGNAAADGAVLASLSRHLGIAPPDALARHHTMRWGRGSLRWERHTEFSTYLWEGPLPDDRDGLEESPFGSAFGTPGAAVSGVRLELRPWTPEAERLAEAYDPASLCFSEVEKGAAAVITDFRQDRHGLTRILVLDRSLSPSQAGALCQRLIEIETYRTLALLGLPLAQQLSPRVKRIEEGLVHVTGAMRTAAQNSEKLLGELTDLAAELEADAVASLYRFGASRAYGEIVEERLSVLAEEAVAGRQTWEGFLQRRMAPAIRTCRSVEERQANLSRKLARAATLLRTRVDVELERQNQDLLTSMNRRAQLQLRLQHTVEGLSVAAVSYYVVGLVGYLAKGSAALGMKDISGLAMAAATPIVVLLVWLMVRRIRRRNDAAEDGDAHG